MILLLLYLFLALVVSFACSIMESVLLSTPKSFLMVKKEKGYKWADSFINLKTDIDKSLSAILTLNTVAHTIGAAGVGAEAVKIFGEVYFGLVSAVLTLLILVFTEIIPKTIGARYWRNLTFITSALIKFTIYSTYPLVILSSRITKLISKSSNEKTTNRDEIAALATIGAEEGVFSENEFKVINNILQLKNVKVADIMTPRVVVAVADQSMKLDEFLKAKKYLNFSRIPVYDNNEENITGYILRRTVMEKLAEDNHTMTLDLFRRDILTLPNTVELFTLWEKLLEHKEHIALIIDEHGGFDGIVTMEDVIETMLGLEIVDEKDTVTNMQQLAREKWKARQKKFNFGELTKKKK